MDSPTALGQYSAIGFYNHMNSWSNLVFDGEFKFMTHDMTGYLNARANDILINSVTASDKSVKNFINKFNSMFDTDVNGNIVAKTNLYSLGGISAYQSGAGISGLTLQGDMNANGKNINNLTSISKSGSKIRLLEGSIAFDIAGFDNQLTIADDGIYANTHIEATGLSLSGMAQATEFKFGSWSFKEVSGNMVIYYNGTAKATIQSSRTNSNL